ncbi:MAG: 50S ribosomal protein L9 [Planctomyces sp.]|nr:50S ribosomal protein L9 [Planctomyces sp.]MBA4120458.1 50S ribosomal protein L9 [Isosphaera sp.]
MPRNIKVLLTENVEHTGIVGDVVSVRKGYARNFLFPRSLATEPSEELVKQLAGKRADAERQLAQLRSQRQALIGRLTGYEMKMVRSCNDQGILYAAVTQHEIAQALEAAGYAGVKDREVRLGQTIKRVDSYYLTVKFDAELQTEIKLVIESDRPLERDRREVEAAEEAALTPAEARQKDRSTRDAQAAAPAEPESKPGTFGRAPARADAAAGAKAEPEKPKGKKKG